MLPESTPILKIKELNPEIAATSPTIKPEKTNPSPKWASKNRQRGYRVVRSPIDQHHQARAATPDKDLAAVIPERLEKNIGQYGSADFWLA